MKAFLAALAIVSCLPMAALADETCPDDYAAAKRDLMINTHLVAITNLSVPADEYASHSGPDSLEIVFLTKPEDGQSRVSADGLVVFLTKDVSDDTQQALISKAFDIRMKRKYGDQCIGPD